MYKIGYTKKKQKNSSLLIKAFQRKFRQQLVNGKTDRECLLISKNLIISWYIVVEFILLTYRLNLLDKRLVALIT